MLSQRPSTLEMNVLTHAHAKYNLALAEQLDFYRASCADSRPNAASRRAHVYEAYAYSMDYQIVLRTTLTEAMKRLPRRLLTELGQVEIAVMYPSADGGMPHTRPASMICFPFSGVMPSADTIEHELWHVHQRQYPAVWADILARAWDFKPWSGTLPKKLEDARRYNPDTIATPFWIWRGTWVPIPVFKYPSSPELGTTVTWFYNVGTGVTSHDVPVDVAAFFGERQQAAVLEHPYETAAYMLSSHAINPSEAERMLRQVLGMGT